MRTPLLIFLGQFSIVLVAAVLRVSNKNWREFHSASFVVVSYCSNGRLKNKSRKWGDRTLRTTMIGIGTFAPVLLKYLRVEGKGNEHIHN